MPNYTTKFQPGETCVFIDFEKMKSIKDSLNKLNQEELFEAFKEAIEKNVRIKAIMINEENEVYYDFYHDTGCFHGSFCYEDCFKKDMNEALEYIASQVKHRIDCQIGTWQSIQDMCTKSLNNIKKEHITHERKISAKRH